MNPSVTIFVEDRHTQEVSVGESEGLIKLALGRDGINSTAWLSRLNAMQLISALALVLAETEEDEAETDS